LLFDLKNNEQSDNSGARIYYHLPAFRKMKGKAGNCPYQHKINCNDKSISASVTLEIPYANFSNVLPLIITGSSFIL